MDAIILAGGKGSRMGDAYPKPLAPIKGKPILAYQLNYLFGSHVIDTIILSLGHRADEVVAFVKKQYPTHPIDFVIEKEPCGTAGGLKKALQKTSSDYVLVLNGDDIVDIDIAMLAQCAHNTICVAHPRLPFGRVCEKDGCALFEEKPLLEDWVNCGWYVLNRKELFDCAPEKGSLEYDVFPKLQLRVHKHTGFWKPVNTKKDIEELEQGGFPKEYSV